MSSVFFIIKNKKIEGKYNVILKKMSTFYPSWAADNSENFYMNKLDSFYWPV